METDGGRSPMSRYAAEVGFRPDKLAGIPSGNLFPHEGGTGHNSGRATFPVSPSSRRFMDYAVPRVDDDDMSRDDDFGSRGTPGGGGAGKKAWWNHEKVRSLATEIQSLEERCGFYETRNKQLEFRLFGIQKTIISAAFVNVAKVLKPRCFHAWNELMHEMRLERQLDAQTKSLDECQEVASHLGKVLSQEQEHHGKIHARHCDMDEDLQRHVAATQQMEQKIQSQNLEIQRMERRLELAEAFVEQSRAEATVVNQQGAAYDKKKKHLVLAGEKRQQGRSLDEERDRYEGLMEEAPNVRERSRQTVELYQQMLPDPDSPKSEAGRRSRPRSPRQRPLRAT
jgi:hypothetical protein